MKSLFNMKSLAAAVTLLAGAQGAQAITPAAGVPEIAVFTAGGAAVDQAYAIAVAKDLAQPGTLDVYSDNTVLGQASTRGARFAGYYFIGKAGLTGADPNPANPPISLAGKRIYLSKRSLGAAGYGAVPVVGSVAIDLLKFPGAGWTETAPGSQQWEKVIGAADVQSGVPDAGLIGVDLDALLKPGTLNYPATTGINEISTGAPAAGWKNNLKVTPAVNSAFTRIPTGGFVYGVAVTKDLYTVLQDAERNVGVLPATAVGGDYSREEHIPSLGRNFIGALLAGKVKSWADVIVDNGTGATLSSYATAANTPANFDVWVGRRNDGAAIGAVAYAKLLNYPYVAGANKPQTLGATYKAPGGVSATEAFLRSHQNPVTDPNATWNPTNAKHWAIAVHSGDRNLDASQGWRYIRIDGAGPTISNVASGDYPYWAEGEVIIKKSFAAANAQDYAALDALASSLSTESTAAAINNGKKHPWITKTGLDASTGVFATTKSDPLAQVRIPYQANHPVVGFSHLSGSFTSLGVVPVPFGNTSTAVPNEVKLPLIGTGFNLPN